MTEQVHNGSVHKNIQIPALYEKMLHTAATAPERFKEIDYLFNHYDLEPKRYIAYDRIAMFGKEDPDFRVTFDKDIRSRVFDLTLYKDDENDYLFEDWEHPANCGLRMRQGGNWEHGWFLT